MDDQLKNSVELEVRKILDESELKIRDSFVKELNAHRTFFQNNFRTTFWCFSIMFIAASAFLSWFFGKDISERIDREVDQKVVEYKIVESYKKKLNELLLLAVEKGEITKKIDISVQKSADKYLTEEINKKVEVMVVENVNKIKGQDINALLSTLIDNRINELRKEFSSKISVSEITPTKWWSFNPIILNPLQQIAPTSKMTP